MGALKPVNYPTFLGDLILVHRGHWEVPDGVSPFKMYLGSHLTTYIHKAFAQPLGMEDHHVDVAVLGVVAAVSLVSVWGLNTSTGTATATFLPSTVSLIP